ncbi:MAG TPA: PA2169 family four-helix-bundle protein [Blastocatellia bacterium]|nr:PA2169 family four-helix-bundle protein [Blastocatellia bacterium]
METTNDKLIDILNDLIRINNDRIEGYERAANEIRDLQQAEIKSLFFKLSEDSRSYKNDLSEATIRLGGAPAQDTTASGKLYRVWMDVKAAFSKDDLKAALESCEYGEDVALKAYQEALQAEVNWPSDISALISAQRQELRASHDKVKRYRDEYKVVNNLKS